MVSTKDRPSVDSRVFVTAFLHKFLSLMFWWHNTIILKKESSNEPISDNDSNATIEYDEMYERPQSPLHSNDIIENETTSDKRRTFTYLCVLSLSQIIFHTPLPFV
jgi:hypothetical protein